MIAFIICFGISFLLSSEGITLAGILIPALIALLIGWLYANGLKSAMNTIAPKRTAAGYLKDSSLKFAANVDRFLYYKTEKTEKPQNKK